MIVEYMQKMRRWILEVKDFWRMEVGGGETKTKIKDVRRNLMRPHYTY